MMGTAEQGGNQPQAVLLVGGPKHGDVIRLPKDERKYEFTFSDLLSPYGQKLKWPEQRRTDSSTHVYALDTRLSDAVGRTVFTHDILRADVHGGFLLSSLDAVLAQLEEDRTKLQAASTRAAHDAKVIEDARTSAQAERKRCEKLENRMQAARSYLESASVPFLSASALLGDYRPMLPPAPTPE